MKILFLNQFFYPDLAPSGRLILDTAQNLVSKGNAVTVLCSSTSYATGQASETGREDLEGIEVIRVHSTRFGRDHRWLRGLDDLSFLMASFLKCLSLPPHDMIFSRWSPPLLPLLAMFLKFRWKCLWVNWVHDLYPDVAVHLGLLKKGSLLETALQKLVRIIFGNSDLIITIGEKIQKAIGDKSISLDKIKVLPDWVDELKIYPVPREENRFLNQDGMAGKFILLYSGNFGLGHEFTTFLSSAQALSKEKDILFLFVGGGPRRNEVLEFIEKNRLDNCKVLPYRNWETLGESLTASDLHLISMRQGLESCMFPSKVYSSLAAGRPFIFVGPDSSEIADLAEKSGAGFLNLLGDVQGLNQLIVRLKNSRETLLQMGQNGRVYFEQHFTKSLAMEKLDKILASIFAEFQNLSKRLLPEKICNDFEESHVDPWN